jgi:hypothetical protein
MEKAQKKNRKSECKQQTRRGVSVQEPPCRPTGPIVG